MKRYILVIGFDRDSSIHDYNDFSVIYRFENLIWSNAKSTRNIVDHGLKHVWELETDLEIEDTIKNILTHVKEDPIYKDLKMTSMEYFEVKENKVIL